MASSMRQKKSETFPFDERTFSGRHYIAMTRRQHRTNLARIRPFVDSSPPKYFHPRKFVDQSHIDDQIRNGVQDAPTVEQVKIRHNAAARSADPSAPPVKPSTANSKSTYSAAPILASFMQPEQMAAFDSFVRVLQQFSGNDIVAIAEHAVHAAIEGGATPPGPPAQPAPVYHSPSRLGGSTLVGNYGGSDAGGISGAASAAGPEADTASLPTLARGRGSASGSMRPPSV